MVIGKSKVDTYPFRVVSKNKFTIRINMATKIKVGIIGGTGLNDPKILIDKTEKNVTTPYGEPSSSLTLGNIEGVDVVLLSRHGKKHEINPSQINYRANIRALQDEGCTHILATNACGSLREDYAIGDLVVLDQFIDRTFLRNNTFYSGGEADPTGVLHIPMGHPFCEETRKVLIDAMKEYDFKGHEQGAIVVIEGPRFSTKAESNMYRLWGGDLIGMTTVPEVSLAKEAKISYASIAMVTDYDAWKEEHVTVEMVVQTMKENASKATKVLIKAVQLIGKRDWEEVIKKNHEVIEKGIL